MNLFTCLFTVFFIFLGCSDDYANLPQITLDFSWPEKSKCFDERSPEITLKGVPGATKILSVNLFDLDNRYDHGGGDVTFRESGTIPEGALDKYRGPCPSYGAPRYELTIKALDENGNVLAFGKKTRKYPEGSE